MASRALGGFGEILLSHGYRSVVKLEFRPIAGRVRELLEIREALGRVRSGSVRGAILQSRGRKKLQNIISGSEERRYMRFVLESHSELSPESCLLVVESAREEEAGELAREVLNLGRDFIFFGKDEETLRGLFDGRGAIFGTDGPGKRAFVYVRRR